MRRLLLALSLTVWLAPPSLAADLAAEQISAYGETGISSRYLLMDANGRAVSNRDFRGRFQLLTFGYPYCPDICATTLAEMAMVISRPGKEADALQALFITFDPERDSADTLRSYTAFFDPRIIGLTASPELVRKAAESFKVRYETVREPALRWTSTRSTTAPGCFFSAPTVALSENLPTPCRRSKSPIRFAK